MVIKADGLAGGKGVIIAEDVETACRTVDSMISDAQFGEAGLQMHRGSCTGRRVRFGWATGPVTMMQPGDSRQLNESVRLSSKLQLQPSVPMSSAAMLDALQAYACVSRALQAETAIRCPIRSRDSSALLRLASDMLSWP